MAITKIALNLMKHKGHCGSEVQCQ